MPLQLYSASPALSIAQEGDVLYCAWRLAPSASSLQQLREGLGRFFGAVPNGAVFSRVQITKLRSIAKEDRATMEEIQSTIAQHARAYAVVLETPPLLAGIARMLFSAIRLAHRHQNPFLLFHSPEDAARWLAPKVGLSAEFLAQHSRRVAEPGLSSLAAKSG